MKAIARAVLIVTATACCGPQPVTYAKPDYGALPLVKTIFVDSLGADPEIKAIRDSLIACLGKTPRFLVVTGPDSADATLRGKLKLTKGNGWFEPTSYRSANGRMQLVQRGTQKVIWDWPVGHGVYDPSRLAGFVASSVVNRIDYDQTPHDSTSPLGDFLGQGLIANGCRPK